MTMKCKTCGNKINLTIFGMSNDICWGCLQQPEKDFVLDRNKNPQEDLEDEKDLRILTTKLKNIQSYEKISNQSYI